MDRNRLNLGETIAGVSAVLLFAFTFFDWYGHEQFKSTSNLLSYLNLFTQNLNAWEALDVIPIFLALTIAVATGAARLALLGSPWEPPIPRNAAAAVLGAISSALILYRIVFPPGLEDIDGVRFHAAPQLGIYLALAAAVGIAFGGGLAISQQGHLRLIRRPTSPTGNRPYD